MVRIPRTIAFIVASRCLAINRAGKLHISLSYPRLRGNIKQDAQKERKVQWSRVLYGYGTFPLGEKPLEALETV